jgi:hypothetical protein
MRGWDWIGDRDLAASLVACWLVQAILGIRYPVLVYSSGGGGFIYPDLSLLGICRLPQLSYPYITIKECLLHADEF